jgi:hypothetical protein
MPLDRLKLRISTLTEPILAGQGFYQLEEDALYVQIGPFTKERRFFSYLESEHVRFDLDRQGRLIFIEVNVPRRLWRTESSIKPPTVVEPADIRWLDFRDRIKDPLLVCNPKRSHLFLRFAKIEKPRNYYLAETVIAEVNDNDELAGIWITDIIDDLAGQQIGAFRKRLRGETAPASS